MALISWNGGKHTLAKKIVSHFPPHVCYIEPFMGACHVLMAKPPRTSKHEVINDTHGELVNLFRVVATRPRDLIHAFRWELVSRQRFHELRSLDTNLLDEVARAHRFCYLMKSHFGGNHGASYGTSRTRPHCLNLETMCNTITAVHKRLNRVTIQNRDYRELPKIYDAPNSLWYLDPPYFDTDERSYTYSSIKLDEFIPFVDSLQGKVVISHWDKCPEFHEHFQGWQRVSLGMRQHQASKRKASAYEELLYIKPRHTVERRQAAVLDEDKWCNLCTL